MSRLTYKDLASYSGRMNGKTLFDKVYNKLGKLETLMEKYDICYYKCFYYVCRNICKTFCKVSNNFGKNKRNLRKVF